MGAEVEDPRIALAYEESVRALAQQQDALDNLRARAGLVLSAAAITSSLFATQVQRKGSPGCLTWDALAAFIVVAIASLAVLWPWHGWRFSNNVQKLLSVWVDEEDASPDVMRREVAEFNQGAYTDNQALLGKLYTAFQVASAALAIEVVLWMIDLGTR